MELKEEDLKSALSKAVERFDGVEEEGRIETFIQRIKGRVRSIGDWLWPVAVVSADYRRMLRTK